MNVDTLVKLFSFFVFGLALTGCATTSESSKSGFLQNYSQLTPLTNFPDTRAYRAEKFNSDYLRSVQTVYVKPFEVWLDNDNLKGVNLSQMAELTGYFQTELKQQLANYYRIVDKPDSATLVIQGAFTKAKTKSPELSAADILPFRIVMNAGNVAYLSATGQKDLVTEVAIEAKFTQGNTDELLFAMTANKELDTTVSDSAKGNSDAVKQVLLEWVNNFSKHIASVKDE